MRRTKTSVRHDPLSKGTVCSMGLPGFLPGKIPPHQACDGADAAEAAVQPNAVTAARRLRVGVAHASSML